MSSLRELFHRPTEKQIGGVKFLVFKLGYDQFADALEVGRWLQVVDFENFTVDMLDQLTPGTPERLALDLVVSGCMSLVDDPLRQAQSEPRRLTPEDLADMPVVMVGEALAVVLEANADFFFQTVPKIFKTLASIRSTGLELLSNLSAQGTFPVRSATTP